MEMVEAQAQQPDKELTDGGMTDEDEQDENEEQDDKVQLNPQEQSAHAEDEVQTQNPHPMQQMVQLATTQGEIVPNSPLFQIPQPTGQHRNNLLSHKWPKPTRIPLIIPVKPSRVNVDILPFKVKSLSDKVSAVGEKLSSDFILFTSINQWLPSQTVSCFKVDDTTRVWTIKTICHSSSSNRYNH